MSNKLSESSPIPMVLNLSLVLFTLFGGILLVSRKLNSERPSPPVTIRFDTIDDQMVEARLWEDPLKVPPDTKRAQSIEDLIEQVSRHKTNLTLLPVMIPGGAYSEDREARIRSRFAVVSALGQSGFVPENAEHIGSATIKWPTARELQSWTTNQHAQLSVTQPFLNSTNCSTNCWSADFPLRYEWYRSRDFFPGSKPKPKRSVLVLWLIDDLFDDAPLTRIPLLLQPFVAASDPTNSRVRLLGPRRSSTLRDMLPGEFKDALTAPATPSTNFVTVPAEEILKQISLYSATASAMDEVLVSSNSPVARSTVKARLKEHFRDAQFFNATDGEMASEVLRELALRGVDLTNEKNHLVLLTEWDTFYGRMLSLTYGAALSVRQGISPDRLFFVDNFRDVHDFGLPPNIHTFAYLRGLDGRTTENDKTQKSDQPGASERKRPDSAEQILHWIPDSNKAEGPSQFDYLSRMASSIESLESDLHNTHRGDVKAIGIAGSDGYDTLVILQALRARFPDILFFTTDLDARFYHPRERNWARNLIVVSSYGLSLHPDLQKEIAPFRESAQTAQFAATLAALGHPRLANLTSIPPRIFEIGNDGAVDLSPTNNAALRLHPQRHMESGFSPDSLATKIKIMLFLALLFIMYYCASPFRKRSSNEVGYLSESFAFTDADVGGPEGADVLIQRILNSNDPFCQSIAKDLRKRYPHLFRPSDEKAASTPPKNREEAAAQNRLQEQRTDAIVGLLNEIVNHDPPLREQVVQNSKLLKPSLVSRASAWKRSFHWFDPRRLVQRFRTRKLIDSFLDELTDEEDQPKSEFLTVARDARKASATIFLSRLGLVLFLILLTAITCLLFASMGASIWRDTFDRPDGEPFSLTSGVSAWPNLILRALSLCLSIGFIIALLCRLRGMFFSLSRRYRIPFETLESDASRREPQTVSASMLWREFQDSGRAGRRLLRIAVPFLLYMGFGFLLFEILGFPFQPVRGESSAAWAGPLRYTFIPFLILTFLTIDAALRCKRFIGELSAAPTVYPATTKAYFRRQRGDVSEEYLDEWIDTQLIADLTENVGAMLWFPAIVFLLMIAALNESTDHWPVPSGLMIILVFNFALALASVIILQQAALKAKKRAEDTLYAKVKKAQSIVAPSTPSNDAAQAEKLLEEIRDLRRGAFARFWESPVFGAFLLPSGGTALIQLIFWMSGR